MGFCWKMLPQKTEKTAVCKLKPVS
uniref:Uncharacterized protein n=1 Tax=Arundo donax TaxID=35708 RepID=A0A0A9A1L8_ARUDO